jgi:predicted nicotinamide N-methyase
MDKKQALVILKQILDAASKSGLFENMEASMTAAQAYNVIATEINKTDGLHAITD